MYNWVVTRIPKDTANLGSNGNKTMLSLSHFYCLCLFRGHGVHRREKFTSSERERNDYTAIFYESLILLPGHTQHIKAVKSLLGTFVLP